MANAHRRYELQRLRNMAGSVLISPESKYDFESHGDRVIHGLVSLGWNLHSHSESIDGGRM
jgi:hypothetical protein